MERDSEDAVIELGTASIETKGQGDGLIDVVNGQFAPGLTDD